jgi:heat shock protein HslJ
LALALICAGCTSIHAEQRTFENTRWRVTAVSGVATPAGGDYSIQFNGGRIGGRLGCNSFGGRYSVSAESIVTGDMASTLMGCPEPAATFESAGLRVLGAPMRWTWVSGLKLTLSNDGGSLQLQRLP